MPVSTPSSTQYPLSESSRKWRGWESGGGSGNVRRLAPLTGDVDQSSMPPFSANARMARRASPSESCSGSTKKKSRMRASQSAGRGVIPPISVRTIRIDEAPPFVRLEHPERTPFAFPDSTNPTFGSLGWPCAAREMACVATSDVVSWQYMNDPALLILTSLSSGAKHGHALLLDIERFAGVRLGPGTLYGALTRLEGRGLIEPLQADDRRRPYRLTAAGTTELEDSLAGLRRIVEVGLTRLAAAT